MTIGNRIRFFRKETLKITQEEFAKKINISRSNLGNIETDTVAVTDRVLNNICDTFNVNELWLRTGQGEMFRTADDDFDILAGKISMHGDQFIKELTRILWTFDEEELLVIKKIVGKIKNSPDL